MNAPQFDTPMLRQYKEIKSQYTDCILFFRLGDFYEMFFDDALTAAKILDLTLTGRGKDESRVPMCGIPYHAAESYIPKLIREGLKVAICEQVEAASASKGITKRDVTQVITPGTVQVDSLLSASDPNYIAAIFPIKTAKTQLEKTDLQQWKWASQHLQYAVSFSDISTGQFYLGLLNSYTELAAFIQQHEIREFVIPDYCEPTLPASAAASSQETSTGSASGSTTPSRQGSMVGSLIGSLINTQTFETADAAERELIQHFNVASLNAFGLQPMHTALPAAWALIHYIRKVQRQSLPQITKITPYFPQTRVKMDASTRRNLELTHSISGQKEGSLYWVLNHTKTAMGARLLKSEIHHPLSDITAIQSRLSAVETVLKDILTREEIREILTQVYDIERLITRVTTQRHNQNPRDCLALKHSLLALSELPAILAHLHTQQENPAKQNDPEKQTDHSENQQKHAPENQSLLEKTSAFLRNCFKPQHAISRLIHEINAAIREDTPISIKEGGVIQDGYNAQLDQLKSSFDDVKKWIGRCEETERSATGIKSLKVRFNKVFGYYIEIPNTQLQYVPAHYIRKQTLANAERYITPELKEKETLLLNGEEKQRSLELDIYMELVQTIQNEMAVLQELAEHVAWLDFYQSLATSAQKQNYTRPTLLPLGNPTFHLTDSRHPVLEKRSAKPVVANTLNLSEETRFLLITGPNMAGKSTVMKQAALIAIMAQIGSFVPAKQATIGLIDQCFTRIGASDDLYSGQSTFMVEMLETANILNNATQNSLILLDEIGRGTSTYDGMSIAGAVTEFIHDTIKARALFATHYHELTGLAQSLKRLKNANMKITKVGQTLTFDYTLIDGPADESYGIHVAKMAGLPQPVIQRAESLLQELEAAHPSKKTAQSQLMLF